MVICKNKTNDIKCKVPRSTTFTHYGIGTIIGKNVTLGDNCVINHHVVIGGKCRIGNNCRIYTGAVIIKDVIVGDNSVIGACALILKDVEPNSKIVGIHK